MQPSAAVAQPHRPVVGVAVIGNEVLSAKIVDANGPLILDKLSAIGVRVAELAIVPDDVPRIAQLVRTFAQQFDWVITTGGVGPTHDDCTWRAVAQAFDLPIALHEQLAVRIAGHLGVTLSAEQQRLAMLPKGVEIIDGTGRWPLFRLRNVYVLPGVPALVARNVAQICEILRADGVLPDALATVYLDVDEWHSVGHIDAVVAAHPAVSIGSYPVFDQADHRLRLTFEAAETTDVQAALHTLAAAVGAEHVLRVTWRSAP